MQSSWQKAPQPLHMIMALRLQEQGKESSSLPLPVSANTWAEKDSPPREEAVRLALGPKGLAWLPARLLGKKGLPAEFSWAEFSCRLESFL